MHIYVSVYIDRRVGTVSLSLHLISHKSLNLVPLYLWEGVYI